MISMIMFIPGAWRMTRMTERTRVQRFTRISNIADLQNQNYLLQTFCSPWLDMCHETFKIDEKKRMFNRRRFLCLIKSSSYYENLWWRSTHSLFLSVNNNHNTFSPKEELFPRPVSFLKSTYIINLPLLATTLLCCAFVTLSDSSFSAQEQRQ